MTVKLGLGTVQLGQPYGNKAQSPLMPLTEAFDILEFALAEGISFFDTANAYGESEARLGQFHLAQRDPPVEVSTKVPVASDEILNSPTLYHSFVMEKLAASKARLGVDHLGLLQFHQSSVAFLETPHVGKLMRQLLDSQQCSAIGISVYTPDEAEAALSIASVSALQIPVNLVDVRFLSPRLLALYKQRDIRLITRTVLLQGVLVDDAAIAPVKRAADLAHIRTSCLKLAGEAGFSSLRAMALAFVMQNCAEILDIVLLGIDSRRSLEENLLLIKTGPGALSAPILQQLHNIQVSAAELDLINPARWNT